jgi:hypothetical protein
MQTFVTQHVWSLFVLACSIFVVFSLRPVERHFAGRGRAGNAVLTAAWSSISLLWACLAHLASSGGVQSVFAYIVACAAGFTAMLFFNDLLTGRTFQSEKGRQSSNRS